MINWAKQPLGETADRKIAARLNVHPSVVAKQRKLLGIPSIKAIPLVDWDSLPYGEISDAQLAKKIGVCRELVRRNRVRRGVPSTVVDWDAQPLGLVPDRALALKLGVPFGRKPDTEIAAELGVSKGHVRKARVSRGIPAFKKVDWDKVSWGLPNSEIARLFGVGRATVWRQRKIK